MATQLVQTNIGPLPYDAIVAQINARYAEGKTPDLAVKSAIQLGIDPAIIATLPGVDASAMRRGMQLISSGAFEESAAGTQADIQTAAPVGSAQYNARIAAGLDAFGFPAEEVRRLTAAGLYGAGKQFDPGDTGQPGLLSEAGGDRFSGLFASQDVLANRAQEVLAASGKANDPRFADAIVGSFTQNGINYNVLGDGSMQGVIETPTGAYLSAGFTPTGQQATEELSTQFEQTSTDRLLGTLANAAIAAGTAAGLGPAGVGLMSVPAAAATGAGFTTFANSGDLAQALRAAALGGATAFGIEQLFPTAIQTAANTAVDLAGTGASQADIVAALVDKGVRAGTAAQMAGDALAGATARQIATDFAGASIGGTAAGATSLAPNLVEVAGSTVAPGLLATAAPSLVGAAGGLLGAQSFPVASQSVPVQSRAAPVETQVAAPAAAAITSQSVPIDVTRTATTRSQAPTVGAATGAITSQSVPLDVSRGAQTTQTTAPSTGAAVGTLTPSDRVIIEDRPIKREEAQILAPIAAGMVAGIPVADVAVPRSSTGPIEGSTTVNPLLALGLLGLAGTALGGGGSTGAPVDQAAYDAIARGRSPVYPRGDFVPAFGPGGRGMFQIAPTDVYNYFGPPYGAGRFGAVVQPFTLPGEAPQTDARAEERRFIASAPTSLLGSPSQANRAAGLLDTGTMRQPQSARTTQTTPQTQEDLVARLRAAREAAGLPSDPTKWTNADKVKAAEIQNEIQGLGEFGRLVVNPETGVTSRTPVQMFSTLPQDQKARAENYLSSVVPVVAERSLQSGAGWGDFYGLSNQYRVSPEELLNFMTPEQRKSFEDRFSYQVGKNDRLFSGDTSFLTSPSATFSPETPEYLRQAATFLPNASPEVRKRLEQAIYSGTAIGNLGETPLLPEEYGSFGVPWWQTPPTLALGIAGVSSGDPLQFYRQQALQQAQGPLSNIFADAGRRSNYGSIGGFDVTASRDNTPYIEDINLYGDRPVSRLKEKYGLSDDQISGLLNLVPGSSLVLGTDNFGRPVYPGEIGSFIAQRARTPGGGFTGEQIIAMSREGLPPLGP